MIINRLMLLRNMTVEQLAEKADVSDRTIYTFRNSLRKPPSRTLNRLANALEIPHWFMVYCYDTKWIPENMDQIKDKIMAMHGNCS